MQTETVGITSRSARQRPSSSIGSAAAEARVHRHGGGAALVALIASVAGGASGASAETLAARFPAPDGFTRTSLSAKAADDYARHLRTLPLLPAGSPVLAYNGRPVHAPWAKAVVDVDVGTRDLQQCADSGIRLFADWYVRHRDPDVLHFHATSGDDLSLKRFRLGERPVVKGSKVTWAKRGEPQARIAGIDDGVYRSFLQTVFMYAGSASLRLDTKPVTIPAGGDLFVRPGSPGHVLVVLDVAEACSPPKTCERQLLLGQGFMPAQSFHVLGWYPFDDVDGVTVPSWPEPFDAKTLRRFALNTR